MYWFYYGMINGESFTELSLITPCSTISVLGTVKIHFLYQNCDTILKILNKLKAIHPKHGIENFDDIEDPAVRDIVKESMSFLRSVILLLFSMMFIVLITFCLLPIVLMIHDYVTSGESAIKYPFNVRYWFDIHETKFWSVIYFHQVWASKCTSSPIF